MLKKTGAGASVFFREGISFLWGITKNYIMYWGVTRSIISFTLFFVNAQLSQS